MARIIPKADWQEFLELLSRELPGKRALIEAASLTLGDQTEANWLPFLGITYDRKDDLVEIILKDVDHLIHKPEQVAVEGPGALLSSIEIIDDDGIHHIMRLQEPVMLPAPH